MLWETNVIGITATLSKRAVVAMGDDSSADTGPRLDVREIDGEPFGEIMTALEKLNDGETLTLVNSFEPEPLYEVLEQRGFEYRTSQVEPDVWEVEISRN